MIIKAAHHLIIYAFFEQFGRREVPMVFLANGKPGYVINQYIFYLVGSSARPSRVDGNVSSLLMLYDFCVARFGTGAIRDEDLQRLVADFIDARSYGTDQFCIKSNHDEQYDYLRSLGLHWKPTNPRNVKRNLLAINRFDKWQTVYHGTPRLNPSEKQFLSNYEVYRDWQRRSGWDPFLHLFGTKEHSREKHSVEVPNQGDKDDNKAKYRKERAFPLKLFVRLVECCSNPRDKMLVLLMGGGSLRRAEPLHLFVQDIEGIDEYGQAKVRLEDPVYGWVEWGKNKRGTRRQFFDECYKNEALSAGHPLRNLMPRTLYGKRNQKFHSGFKGMTFSESDSGSRLFRQFDEEGMKTLSPFHGSYDMAEGFADGRPYDVFNLWWIDPRIGGYFYKCFEEYMSTYIYKNPFTGAPNPKGWPYHPWLFIKIGSPDTYGYPLSYTAVTKIWERLTAKVIRTFPEGPERDRVQMILDDLAWHSLRHFYGFYCANVLQLQMQIVQVLMHHASLTSTEVYYKLGKSTIKEEISRAILRKVGYDMEPEHVILPNTPRIEFPDYWSSRFQSLLLLK